METGGPSRRPARRSLRTRYRSDTVASSDTPFGGPLFCCGCCGLLLLSCLEDFLYDEDAAAAAAAGLLPTAASRAASLASTKRIKSLTDLSSTLLLPKTSRRTSRSYIYLTAGCL